MNTTSQQPKLEEVEGEAKKRTWEDLPDALNLLTRIINGYINGFGLLGSFTYKQDQVNLVIPLVSRSFNSARSAMLLLESAYYSPAIAVTRTIDEDWVTVNDIVRNPETAAALWQGQRPRPFQDMANAMGADWGDWWRDTYGYESEITHPRSLAVRLQVQGSTLRLGPIYDQTLALGTLYLLIPAALRMLLPLRYQLIQDAEWAREIDRISESCRAWLGGVEATWKGLPEVAARIVPNLPPMPNVDEGTYEASPTGQGSNLFSVSTPPYSASS